jgi:hypothetical protein
LGQGVLTLLAMSSFGGVWSSVGIDD